MSRRTRATASDHSASVADDHGDNVVFEPIAQFGAAAGDAAAPVGDVPQMANPLYNQFIQFQQFQAFMAQNPQPVQPIFGRNIAPPPAVDPGMLVAMSQVKPPTLEGLKINQIKAFRIAYRRYEAKCLVAQFKRLPGQLVLPEHLVIIARTNGIDDIEDVRDATVEDFFQYLCRIHSATMTSQWCRMVEEVKMKVTTWSFEAYMEYAEDFRIQALLAGRDFAPPEKEVVKIFVKGLRPETLQTEIRRRNLDTLEEAMDVTSDVVIRYKAIFDLQPNLRKEDSKSDRYMPSIDQRSKTRGDGKFGNHDKPTVPSTIVLGKSKSSFQSGLSSVTCYKCLKKGHLAPNCPNEKHPQSTWRPCHLGNQEL
jgi:hypothetical protein